MLTPAPGAVPPPGLDGCRSLLAYDEGARRLVHALKFANCRGAVQQLGAGLAALLPADVSLVTWAPTTTAHRRRRGFDQAELLARAAARSAGLPCRPVIARTGAAQTGLDRLDRLTGPTFLAARPATGTVAVVDDVRTTGSTLAAAAAAIRAAGASRVVAVTLAAKDTPPAR